MEIKLESLDELSDLIPREITHGLQKHYLEYPPKGKKEIGVIQRHCIGKACHYDIRLKKNGNLIGWSIVGFSLEQDPDLDTLELNKRYRVESKAVQPLIWLFKDRKIGEEWEWDPGKIGAGVEAPGRMKILDRLEVIFGAQKPYFHEYFIKGTKRFKDWTRITITAISARRIDPETKEPIGPVERLWTFMIPKDQKPYAITKRAMNKKWKPPKDIVPFPEDWTKENWPKEYERWLEYMKKTTEEKSKVTDYAFVMVSWMGARAKTGRRMPQIRFYLLIKDKAKSLRTFLVDGNMLTSTSLTAFRWERVPVKWLKIEGFISPEEIFNPNKRLAARYSILASGKISYETDEADPEHISLKFKTGTIKGSWILRQHEKGSEIFILEKITKSELVQTEFVLHEHTIQDLGTHWDIRFKNGREINLFSNPLKERGEIKAIRKFCRDIEKWWITEGSATIKIARRTTKVRALDHGPAEILNDTVTFSSFVLKGRKLNGYFVLLKRDKLWIFKPSERPGEEKLAEPKPYDPWRIVDIKGRPTFRIELFDLRDFTRCEVQSKVPRYLDFDVPSGVKIGVCLYTRPGALHGAKIAYVIFDRDKWTLNKAVEWIRQMKLDKFSKTQIREKREESSLVVQTGQDEIVAWLEISRIDVPGREVIGYLLTPEGKKEAQLGSVSDHVISELLTLYKAGKNTVQVRIWRGYILQILDYVGSEKDERSR